MFMAFIGVCILIAVFRPRNPEVIYLIPVNPELEPYEHDQDSN